MKKKYQKPEMMVVQLQQQHVLCSSPAAAATYSDDVSWKNGGFDEDEVDY